MPSECHRRDELSQSGDPPGQICGPQAAASDARETSMSMDASKATVGYLSMQTGTKNILTDQGQAFAKVISFYWNRNSNNSC